MRALSALLLLLYLIVMFPLLHRLEQLNDYASYYFEAGFVLLVAALFRKRVHFRPILSEDIELAIALSLLAGLVGYRCAGALGLIIPWDLNSRENLLFLLLIGPILEELVFRLAIWELLTAWISNWIAVLIITSGLFSFAHFFAWFSVPAEFHSFVAYQTAYVFFLALACGIARKRSGSMTPPILIHATFNLGFYLGFLR